MTYKRITEADQMVLLLSPQREMAEIRQKNEEEIHVLRRENKEMKRHLVAYSSIEKQPIKVVATRCNLAKILLGRCCKYCMLCDEPGSHQAYLEEDSI